jgi:ubiquinone/menaquinone biosynthesis C-methylase UbiE
MPTTTGVEFQQQFVGKVLLALKDVLRRGEFWGIDNSLEMLDKVPRKDDLVLKTCSAEILEDVPDNYFDLITARMVFHHINDSSAAMQSAFRALKKRVGE